MRAIEFADLVRVEADVLAARPGPPIQQALNPPAGTAPAACALELALERIGGSLGWLSKPEQVDACLASRRSGLGYVGVCDVATDQQPCSLAPELEVACAACFSPNGGAVALISSGRLHLHDAHTGSPPPWRICFRHTHERRPMAGWWTRTVLLSNTFRDAQSERDWLREPVIPEREERLRAPRPAWGRGSALGVKTVSRGDDAAKSPIVSSGASRTSTVEPITARPVRG